MKNYSSKQNELLVGVVSDTHGVLSNACYAALADCDFIIHAGDIGAVNIYHSLKNLAPVVAVLGNNDFKDYGSEVASTAKALIGGVRFFVAHYPQQVNLKTQSARYFEPGEPLAHICIHGHTHVPQAITGKEASPASLILCPGSPSGPRSGSAPSIAKISLKDGTWQDYWFEEVSGK